MRIQATTNSTLMLTEPSDLHLKQVLMTFWEEVKSIEYESGLASLKTDAMKPVDGPLLT